MTRRNFAAVVAVPVGALALPVVRAAAQPAASQGPARSRRALRDPVLTQLDNDIHGLIAEAKGNAGSRKQSMRAIEALLMVGGTHFALHYDAEITRRVTAAVRSAGSAETTVARLLQSVQNPEATLDQYRQGLELLRKAPLSAHLRQTAINLGDARKRMPEAVLAGYRPVIYMNCSDLRKTVDYYSHLAAVLGAFALVEPGPFFEAGVVAAGLVAATYQATYWFQGC